MKRLNNIYEKIYDMNNLILADKKASKGKSNQTGVIEHNKNKEQNLLLLQQMLKNKTYKTSDYKIFKVFEPKERDVYRLPYFPDRIAHHAIMNILEKIFVSVFIKDSYSSIKKRGIHGAANIVKKFLKDKVNTKYCLKLDIKKFYPSINNDILKELLKKKFKDKDLLWLLYEIIDSVEGVPIGNYLSQYFANFYLTYFDHWLKEDKKIKYYVRYADDIVILAKTKEELHILFNEIKNYLENNLKLKIKENYQIFPVESRGIDFVGYKFYHTHILLRKNIKKNLIKMLLRNNNDKSMSSYNGWLKYCDSKNLVKKLIKMNNFKDFNIEPIKNGFIGDKIHILRLLNKEIKVCDYKLTDSKIFVDKGTGKCLQLQIIVDDEYRVLFTSSAGMIYAIKKIPKENFPFSTTIIENDKRYFFS